MAATSRVTRSTARSSEGFVPILPPTPISPITTTRRRKRRGLSAEIDISPVNDETPDYRPASLPSKPPKRQRVRIGTPISPTPGVKADKRRLQAESEASASHNIVDPLQRINLAQGASSWFTLLLHNSFGRSTPPRSMEDASHDDAAQQDCRPSSTTDFHRAIRAISLPNGLISRYVNQPPSN